MTKAKHGDEIAALYNLVAKEGKTHKRNCARVKEEIRMATMREGETIWDALKPVTDEEKEATRIAMKVNGGLKKHRSASVTGLDE